MNVWTIANQKGGVGKTTTVASLGGTLVKLGKKVLMIDTDPHASLGYCLGINSETVSGSLFDLFVAHDKLDRDCVMQYILPTQVDGLDLLPATMALATLDHTLGNQEGMGLIIRNILQLIEQDYDVVLIDCLPVLGGLMINALAASHHIIIPVQTEFLALKGLDRMLKTIGLMGKSKQIKYSYTIVPTMYDRRTKTSAAVLQKLSEDYSDALWPDVIPIDTKFRDATLNYFPAPQYVPGSRGVKAYEKLLNFLTSGEMKHVKIG